MKSKIATMIPITFKTLIKITLPGAFSDISEAVSSSELKLSVTLLVPVKVMEAVPTGTSW